MDIEFQLLRTSVTQMIGITLYDCIFERAMEQTWQRLLLKFCHSRDQTPPVVYRVKMQYNRWEAKNSHVKRLQLKER